VTDLFDELRIIAQDSSGLAKMDRDTIRRAADEMESLCKMVIQTNEALIRSQWHHIAVNDQLIKARRHILHLNAELNGKAKPGPKWTISSGWVQVTVPSEAVLRNDR
jgi:hypothetical protein